MRGSRFWLPGAVVGLGSGLRLLRLDFQPLWWDEGWSVYFASGDVRSLLQLTAVDIHPPFYYLVLKLWILIFGSSPFALRLFSVLVGSLTVILLIAIAQRLLGGRGALVVAALAAVSPLHIYYSQEVRMYGLVTLLCLASLYLACQTESDRWRPGAGAAYVLVASAALYTQYYAAFFLLGLNLAVLLRWSQQRRPLRRLVPWAGAQLAVFFVFLPWLYYAGDKLLMYVNYKVDVEADAPLALFTYLGHHLAAFHWGHVAGVLSDWWWLGTLPLLVFGLYAGAAVWHRKRRTASGDWVLRGWAWLLPILLAVLLLGFGVNLALPFNPPRGERLLLLALPVYILLWAMAFLYVWDRARVLACAALGILLALTVLSLATFYSVPRYPDDDYRPVALRIEALAKPSDLILCVHPWQVGYFRSYLPNEVQRPATELTPRDVLPRERQLWADDAAQMATDLEALLEQHSRIWLPAHQTMGHILEDQIQFALAAQAYPVLSEWYGESTVLGLFTDGDPTKQSAGGRFGDSLVLTGAALDAGPLEAGWAAAAIDLQWQLEGAVPDSYQVGLRLTDETGYVWAQRDRPPASTPQGFAGWAVGGFHSDRHGLLVPAGTPPGTYRVTLRVYRRDDLSVLPVSFEGGSGGEMSLGTVEVVRPAISPRPEASDYTHPLDLDYGGTLRLIGYTPKTPYELIPGEAVTVELVWRALKAPGEDYLPKLLLTDAAGGFWAERTEKPVMGRYPTAWWQAGELVRDPQSLLIPAAAPAGGYHLLLELVQSSQGTAVPFRRDQTGLDLGQLEVLDVQRWFVDPMPDHRQLEAVGPSVELIGYDLNDVVRQPGTPLEVTLYWHAVEGPGRNYDVFVHLLDADGRIVAQDDGPPAQGKRPAFGWLPGEYVSDARGLQLPPALPDGVYRLEVGLVDPVTHQRPSEPAVLEMTISVSADTGCWCP